MVDGVSGEWLVAAIAQFVNSFHDILAALKIVNIATHFINHLPLTTQCSPTA
jgi:hypothetical protein